MTDAFWFLTLVGLFGFTLIISALIADYLGVR